MADAHQRNPRSTTRVLLEFSTIVIGVLVALGVDQWADGRADHELEGDYVARLIQEVGRDVSNHSTWIALIREKQASLDRIGEFLNGTGTQEPDAESLLRDIATATNFAWNVGPLAVTATYDDLRGSGNLGLIDDADLRFALVQYYSTAEGMDRRIEARGTGFPDISYRLFRRAPDGNESVPEVPESPAETDRLVSGIWNSDLGEHITAEINRARFTTTLLTQLTDQATQLLQELERYAETR